MDNNHPTNRTPNLDNNIKNIYGKKRVKWLRTINFNDFIYLKEFDLKGTEFESFNDLICATGKQISENELILSIYRYDKKDQVTENNPVNVYEFIIRKNFFIKNNIKIYTKSTSYDNNMINTLNNYDLTIQEKSNKIKNHHIKDIPDDVKKVLNIYKKNYEKLIGKDIIC